MSTSGSTRRPVLRFFWASTRNSHGAFSGGVLYKGQPLGFQPVGAQHSQHLSQPLRAVTQRQPPAVLQKPEAAGTDILQSAGVFVPGKGVGGILALRPLGKIRGIARAHVKLPLVLPPCAQVGTDGGDVGELLLFHRCCQQSAYRPSS